MEIVVASGKGGTGKTFVSSNLTYFLRSLGAKVVAVDADAEAPDLLLALGGASENVYSREVYRSRKAVIDYGRCVSCMKCFETCRFNAIELSNDKPVVVEEYCEGCGACSIVCPSNAISFVVKRTGLISCDVSKYGIKVVTADLEVGGRNTGELVYMAKEEAHRIADSEGAKYIVVDAAAGIGCPVISSLAGADILIVVVEPSPQSLKGARRLLEVAESFRTRNLLILNKYDLNPDFSEKVASTLGIEVLGKIPYDYTIVKAYASMTPFLAYSSGGRALKPLVESFRTLYEGVLK